MKMMAIHVRVFKKSVLEDAKSIIDLVVNLINHDNSGVKYNASDCLEALMGLLASELDESYKFHEETFNYII